MFSDSKKVQPSLTNSVGAPSIISHSLTITGNLKTTGDLQIDGAVIGDIAAARVMIGDAAKVHGEVTASEIVVRGEARGALKGGIIEITRTAKVHGDIEHESLAIESGAQVDGSMKHVARPVVVAAVGAPDAAESQTLTGAAAARGKDKAAPDALDLPHRSASPMQDLTQRSSGRAP